MTTSPDQPRRLNVRTRTRPAAVFSIVQFRPRPARATPKLDDVIDAILDLPEPGEAAGEIILGLPKRGDLAEAQVDRLMMRLVYAQQRLARIGGVLLFDSGFHTTPARHRASQATAPAQRWRRRGVIRAVRTVQVEPIDEDDDGCEPEAPVQPVAPRVPATRSGPRRRSHAQIYTCTRLAGDQDADLATGCNDRAELLRCLLPRPTEGRATSVRLSVGIWRAKPLPVPQSSKLPRGVLDSLIKSAA